MKKIRKVDSAEGEVRHELFGDGASGQVENEKSRTKKLGEKENVLKKGGGLVYAARRGILHQPTPYLARWEKKCEGKNRATYQCRKGRGCLSATFKGTASQEARREGRRLGAKR